MINILMEVFGALTIRNGCHGEGGLRFPITLAREVHFICCIVQCLYFSHNNVAIA